MSHTKNVQLVLKVVEYEDLLTKFFIIEFELFIFFIKIKKIIF